MTKIEKSCIHKAAIIYADKQIYGTTRLALIGNRQGFEDGVNKALELVEKKMIQMKFDKSLIDTFNMEVIVSLIKTYDKDFKK